jgi:hypothetical protein
VNTIEEQFQAAGRALARALPDDGVPPLHLAAHPRQSLTVPAGRIVPWSRGWLIPLAAAAAVIAVLAGLQASARDLRPGRAAQASAGWLWGYTQAWTPEDCLDPMYIGSLACTNILGPGSVAMRELNLALQSS